MVTGPQSPTGRGRGNASLDKAINQGPVVPPLVTNHQSSTGKGWENTPWTNPLTSGQGGPTLSLEHPGPGLGDPGPAQPLPLPGRCKMHSV